MKRTAATNFLFGLLAVWAEIALSQRHCNSNATFKFYETAVVKPNESLIITSPNFRQAHPRNKQCYWRVRSDFTVRESVIKVVFNSFRLGNSINCENDSLTFFSDYSDDNERSLGRFCGIMYPEVLYTERTNLWPTLAFVSIVGQDTNYSDRRFSLTLTLVPEEEAAGVCRYPNVPLNQKEPQRITASSGRIFTPHYPVPFQSKMTCTWIITVPEGHTVRLKFDDYQLTSKREVNSACADEAYVEIRDGDNENSKSLALYCDRSEPTVLESTKYTSLWIRFDARHGAPNRGFTAHYQAIPFISDVECVPGNVNNHNLKLEGSSGTFSSTYYYTPGKPASWLTCIWLITVPDGKLVKLTIDTAYLQADCKDYLSIRDGPYNSSKLTEERLCADTYSSPKDIRSSGRHLRIEYTSYRRYVLSPDTGFTARFKAVPKPEMYWISAAVVGAFIVLCASTYAWYFFKRRRSRQTTPRHSVQNESRAQTNQSQLSTVNMSLRPPAYEPPYSQTDATAAEIRYPKYGESLDSPYSEDPPPPYTDVRDPPPPYSREAENT